MKLDVEVIINGTKEAVWRAITDIENSTNMISGIDEIEILEKPANSFVGLKWRETRTLFGKSATEVMWITDATENKSYKTRAESHGSIYITIFELSENGGKTNLKMTFDGKPRTFGAKLMSAITGRFFLKATKDALMKDLADIKATVEQT